MRRYLFQNLCLLCLLAIVEVRPSFALQLAFNCEDSKVKSSITYSALGKYRAQFNKCRGTINYDEKKEEITNVNVEIITDSISSNCTWCDKIVLSKRLLDSATYPKIIFKSDSFSKKEKESWASGTIDFHGHNKKLSSPFQFKKLKDGQGGLSLLVKGQWVINRKDFGIVWDKVLDKGGVIVGNDVTIDWEIIADK